jgi:AcrR family transcriptional regulator
MSTSPAPDNLGAMATGTKKRAYAPRMPPAERREQLLDAALALIGERGYGGVSMEAIARQAGVTKPVVYDLFRNLGELLTALLEREEARALAQLAEVMPDEPSVDPDELIVIGFVAFLDSVAASPTSWRLILMPAEGTPSAVRDRVESNRRQVATRLEQLIAWGIDGRGGPKDLDVELAAQVLIAAAEQMARLVLTDPERFTPERAGQFVRTLLAAVERPG